MDKLLLITPHLSTGGLPQFLLDKIHILISEYEIYLVEWANISGDAFVVQRNKIVDILKSNFYSLGDNKSEVLNIIEKVNPKIIHFEEFPETFADRDILEKIYNKDIYITETTHGTSFNPDDKMFIPDKMLFVSNGNFNQYRHLCKDSDVIEFPMKWKKRNERLINMGLDPKYKHVLNVGLFTPGKNQSEIFEIAKKMKDYKIMFHFVGNQAGNFQNYWSPLMEDKPDNCVVWGERNDVEKFYISMDLFLFTSKWENRPLSVLEALNHDMKVLIHNLNNYVDGFSKFENVEFLTSDIPTNIQLILESLDINSVEEKEEVEKEEYIETIESELNYTISAYHILTDIETEREIRSIADISKLEDFGINYKPIISKRYTELPPKETCAFPDIVSMEPGGKLTPAHYGCYLGHRKAFETGYNENPDYMLIFECDCILDASHQEFINKMNEAIEIVEKEELFMFSFGFHNNQSIIKKEDYYYIVYEFIGAHAYLIPRSSYQQIFDTYQNEKWNVADLFMGNNFRRFKHGIFPKPITKQAGGISILENLENEDRY
jgi:glycosyltransferase involved in cell wall biosynthesis